MRSIRSLPIAALATLPLATAAGAGPLSPTTASASLHTDTSANVIQVRGGGFGGGGFHGGGGFGGGGFHGGGFHGGGFHGGGFHGGGFRGSAFHGGMGHARAFHGAWNGNHWHGGHGHGHGHGRRFPIFVGGVGFYGGYPYDDYYYDDYYYGGYAGDGVARCAARYRSFDPATGTFLATSGERLPCPYL